jgi:hypothetical protein
VIPVVYSLLARRRAPRVEHEPAPPEPAHVN